MTWRVNFVRSKDTQKQLARTSLTAQRIYQSMIMPIFTYCGYSSNYFSVSRKPKPRNHISEMQSPELWSPIFNS